MNWIRGIGVWNLPKSLSMAIDIEFLNPIGMLHFNLILKNIPLLFSRIGDKNVNCQLIVKKISNLILTL